MSHSFTEEQKQYLQGFFAGMIQTGASPFTGETSSGQLTSDPSMASVNLAAPAADAAEPASIYGTPFEKLNKEEKLKLEKNPLDMWQQMCTMAEEGRMAEGGDVFRFKFHGLFNTAPTQEGYMLRCRMPGCCVSSDQMDALTRITTDFGGGYSHVTTRGNLQIREISAQNSVPTLLALAEAGLTSRGAGGDNIRNITCSPLSGVDPQELLDCRPYARALHHYILNTREFYGLPRKFNVAFDSGGAVSIMADTNDIGFFIVEVPEGQSVEAGLYARVEVGGVAGHGHFARDLGVLIKPEEMVTFAAAILRVFVRNGNRTNRKRARLAYCVEAMGRDVFLEEVKSELDKASTALEGILTLPRPPIDRFAHIGFHPQIEDGTSYCGIAVLVGKLTPEQMTEISNIARELGNDTVHFTIWQNVILQGIADENIELVKARLAKVGLETERSCATSCLAACTGNTGCKLSQTDTKGCAGDIARHLDATLNLKDPVSIVLTGCPNSCAQHLCADIGLLGIKSKRDGESIEAYNISIGGGTDAEQGFSQDLFKAVPADEVPRHIEGILRRYQEEGKGEETFVEFARRHNPSELATELLSGGISA